MGMIPEKDQWEAGQYAVISTADAYCYARFDYPSEAWGWVIENMPTSLDDKEVTVVELTTTSKSDYSFWRKLEVSNFERRLNGEPEDKWYIDDFGYPCKAGTLWNKKRANKPPVKSKSKPTPKSTSKPAPAKDIQQKKKSDREGPVYRDWRFETTILRHIAERIKTDLMNNDYKFIIADFDWLITMSTKVFKYAHGVELYDNIYVNMNINHPCVYIDIYKFITSMFSVTVRIDGPVVFKPDEIDCPVKIDMSFHEEDSRLEDMIKIILYGVFGYIPDIPHKETTMKAIIPYVNIAGQYYRCKTIIKEDDEE